MSAGKYAGVRFTFSNVNTHVIQGPPPGSASSSSEAYLEQVRREVAEVIYKHNKERTGLVAEIEYLKRELQRHNYIWTEHRNVLAGRDKSIKRLKKQVRKIDARGKR